MGIFRRDTAPEQSLNIAPGNDWFFDASDPHSQGVAQRHEPGYEQSASPDLTIVEHPKGALTWSNGVPLPDDAASSYWLLKHAQQSEGGSYIDDSPAGDPGQYGDTLSSHQPYPTELSISITEDIRVTVGDERYLEFGAQVLRERYDRNRRMHESAFGQSALPAPVQFEAQPYQPGHPAIESGKRQLTEPQGSPGPRDHRPLQDQNESPMDDQSAPDQEPSKKELRQLKAEQRKQKAEQRGPAIKVGIMLAVGGIAAGAFFVGLDKSTTAVYQFVAGNTSSPLWSTKGKHDVERFPLIGPLLSYPVPNIHGGSVNGEGGK